jgi:arylsulfatase A-like enzyme
LSFRNSKLVGAQFIAPFILYKDLAGRDKSRPYKLGGVLLLILFCSCQSTSKPTTPPVVATPIKNVLLITIDTLRPDALSIYGNSTKSPFFERIAPQSVIFERAFTVAPLTLPAHTSLLTGLYPPVHGVRNNGTFRVSPNLKLLSEIAQQHGFATGAVIGGFPLSARFGLNQGFETYDDSFSTMPDSTNFNYAEKNAESVRLSAQSWLDETRGKSFFLWTHFFDPHHPYLKHGNSSLEPYLQEVLYVDQQLELFFDFLRSKNLLYETLIIIVGDHGEAFGEHQEISHSLFVYNTTLHIPLIISAPGYKSQRRKEVVRIIDVFPTVLQLMNWKDPTAIDGVSLVPLLKNGSMPALEAYSETMAPALDFGWSPLFAIQDGEHKYIQAPQEEFYDLKQDRDESHNLAGNIDTSSYRNKIQSLLARTPPESSTRSLTAEEREKLESLGYFSSGAHLPKGSQIDPKDRVEIAHRIAELSTSNLQLPEKAKAYADLIQSDPNNPVLLLRYAEILLKLNRLKEAKRIFQKVIDSKYESVAPYNGLASLYFQQKNVTLAELTLQLAVQKNLADGETFYNLAEINLNRRLFKKAFEDYALSMNFRFMPAFYRVYDLAVEFQKQGDREKSLEAQRIFLEHATPEIKKQFQVSR